MGLLHSPTITTDGLVLMYDPANFRSYQRQNDSSMINLINPLKHEGFFFDHAVDSNNSVATTSNFQDHFGGTLKFNESLAGAPLTRNTQMIDTGFDDSNRAKEYTIGCWFYPHHSSRSDLDAGFSYASGPFHKERHFQINWSHSQATFRNAVGLNDSDGTWHGVNYYPDSDMPGNQWYYVSATYAGTKLRVYLNGDYVDSATTSGGVGKHPTPVTAKLGRHALDAGGNSARGWRGEISNTHYYNRALTDIEVLNNYNALNSRFGL